jgi:large subunit ribosomal protein MRP49
MRSLGERLTKLNMKLTDLKCGPGAAIMPANVSRIHMDFALQMAGGHVGAKKFWREQLPRLKYHNPAVPMIVNTHKNADRPPVMSIYLRKGDASSSDAAAVTGASSRHNKSRAPAPASNETVVHIDMKMKLSSHIYEYLLAETKAVPLKPSKEDIRAMQDLADHKRQSAFDRARVRQLMEEKKKDEDMLRRARAAGGMGDEES